MASISPQALLQLERSLVGLSGQARRVEIQRFAGVVGCSERTVYRALKRKKAPSEKRRGDRGQSQLTRAHCELLAGIVAQGRNKRGDPQIALKRALGIAIQRGLVPDVSYSTAARTMRQLGLGPTAMMAPEPAVQRRSLHPNHVWQIDCTICAQWHLPEGEAGPLEQDLHAELNYEGRRHRLASKRQVLHRYMVVDHCTGAFYVRYYYAPGETSYDVADVLIRAMLPEKSDNPDVDQALPFHGMPRRIVMDLGSAFNNGLIRGFLDALGIAYEYHGAGNAKASGSVEKTHGVWNRYFEGPMGLRPAQSLDELNRMATAASAVLQAEAAFRAGAPRFERWLHITPEQLRVPPPRDVLERLVMSKPETGTLTNQLRLRAGGRQYELAGGIIFPGAKVQWRPAPFVESGIRVWDENGTELATTELVFDEVSGFAVNARGHTWDDPAAAGASPQTTPAAEINRAAKAGDLSIQFDDLFDDLAARAARVSYLQTRSAGTATTAAPSVLLSQADVIDEVLARLDRRLTRAEGSWWREQAQDGLTEDAFEAAWDTFTRTAGAANTGT